MVCPVSVAGCKKSVGFTFMVDRININVFQAVEDFVWQAADLLDRLDDLQEDLSRNDFADDIQGAKHSIDIHADMKKKIMKAPVEEIDMIGQRLLRR